MAMLLKKQFELLTLKVSMRIEERQILSRLELESNEGGVPRTLERWTLSPADLGLPRQLPPSGMPQFTIPSSILDTLRKKLDALDVPPWHPIWLFLVKPYGYLGLVPWETLLVPFLARPLLRLPDFLERPRENRSVLDIAICSSAPVSEPTIYPPHLLAGIVGSILTAPPRPRTNIHIFADAGHYGDLVDEFANESRVSVHDPHNASRYGEQARTESVPGAARAVSCPWLLWIRDAMRGRSLDAVHFVCHGYLADDRPALSLAESPMSNRDARDARYVGVAELATFLTQIGAWATVFSDPPENYSEAGLRLFADTLAQTRPGPVLFHSLRLGHPATLDAAYGFLFATVPRQPPTDRAIFTYCQPELVATQEAVQRPAMPPAIDLNASLFAATPPPPRVPDGYVGAELADSAADVTATPLEQVPNWLAAAQRHVEDVSLDLQRRRANISQSEPALVRRTDTTEETLGEMQQIIGQFASKLTGTDETRTGL